jgi:hypothetical protein
MLNANPPLSASTFPTFLIPLINNRKEAGYANSALSAFSGSYSQFSPVGRFCMTTAWAHDNGGDALSPESAMLHPGSPESPFPFGASD